MSTNIRDPFYAELNATTFAVLQLDPGVYDTDIFPALGLQKTAPPSSAVVIPMTIRQALKTGRIVSLRASVENAGKSRSVPLVCEISKVGSAPAGIRNKTMRLGDNNVSWTVKSSQVGGRR